MCKILFLLTLGCCRKLCFCCFFSNFTIEHLLKLKTAVFFKKILITTLFFIFNSPIFCAVWLSERHYGRFPVITQTKNEKKGQLASILFQYRFSLQGIKGWRESQSFTFVFVESQCKKLHAFLSPHSLHLNISCLMIL